jgi:Domain of unknown function (DUF1995)
MMYVLVLVALWLDLYLSLVESFTVSNNRNPEWQVKNLSIHHNIRMNIQPQKFKDDKIYRSTTGGTIFSLQMVGEAGSETGRSTELPDSLDDSAVRAAKATLQYCDVAPIPARCQITFDTSVGDETYSIMKTSTDFMQQLVSNLCYELIPGLKEQKQKEMMNVIQAKSKLNQLQEKTVFMGQSTGGSEVTDESVEKEIDTLMTVDERIAQEDELVDLINRNGRDLNYKWDGPVARIYFPDEGSAAYARQQWLGLLSGGGSSAKVPLCCEFSSCSGVPVADISRDRILFFFCPKAGDSDNVETILQRAEQNVEQLKVTVFVNPNLVDMGVTGFGMAGRMLRERLLDALVNVYYLRTLPWGALTRQWPSQFSVWQEDSNAIGGYRLLQSLDTLPSNPDVEDIYDIANGLKQKRQGGGLLDQFGDFVNGMMKL